ncbi:protein kinase [Planctomycetota bacterium]|nr:protein kinase [Planctomycetota bacterium]
MTKLERTDGTDTALARLLHLAKRVPLNDLQDALAVARGDETRDLASVLCERSLISQAELSHAWLPRLGAVRADTLRDRWSTLPLSPQEVAALAGKPPAAHDAPILTLGAYEIVEELGRGGMGVVLKGYDPRLRRYVAIKRIKGEVGVEDLLRFQREAELTAKLRHPNIAAVHEVVSEGEDAPYLVMDFVEGSTLASMCRGNDLTGRQVAEIMAGISQAIAAAHAQGVVHRDLKPHNVVVSPDGTPMVLDFGLARRVEDESVALTMTGDVLGTPVYMAPEQARGQADVGPLADVYGLGAVMFECLTGQPPFGGGTVFEVLQAVTADEPPRPRSIRPRVHVDLETICLTCLEKDPASRYPSAQALEEDLRRFLRGEPIEARPVGRAVRLWRLARRRPWALASVLALAVLTGLGGWGSERLGHQEEVAGLHARGLVLKSQGDLNGALAAFGEALVLEPHDPELLHARGSTYRSLGELGLARQDFDRAIHLRPMVAGPYVDRGLVCKDRGDWEGAEADWTRAILLAPEDADALRLRGSVRLDLGRFDEALADAGEASRLAPDSHLVLLLRSRVRRQTADLSGALADASRAIALAPTYGPCFGARAGARLGLNDLDGAESDARTCVALAPDNPGGYVSLGRTLEARGDRLGALRCYDEGLALVPNAVTLLARRGLVRGRLGDLEGGLADAREVARLSPNSHEGYAVQGLLLAADGDFAAAEQAFAEVVRRRPTDAEMLTARGYARQRLGKLEGALADYQASLDLDPIAETYVNLGSLLQMQDDSVGAAEAYAAALVLDPENAVAWANQGTLKADLGDREGAAHDFEESLRLVPTNPQGDNMRASVRAWLGRDSRF